MHVVENISFEGQKHLVKSLIKNLKKIFGKEKAQTKTYSIKVTYLLINSNCIIEIRVMLSMMCLPNSVYVNLERLVKIKGELHSQCKKRVIFHPLLSYVLM